MDTSGFASLALRDELARLCQSAFDMLHLAKRGFLGQVPALLDQADVLGRDIHRTEKELVEKLLRDTVQRGGVSGPERFFVPIHVERIGDNVELFTRATRTMIREGALFTDRARREIEELVSTLEGLLDVTRDLVLTGSPVLAAHILARGREFVSRANEYASFHESRLIEGICATKSSSVYLAMLDDLKGVEWHVREIATQFEQARARLAGEQARARLAG